VTDHPRAAHEPIDDSLGVDLLRAVLGSLLRNDKACVAVPPGLERAFLAAAKRHRVVVFLWLRRANLDLSEGLASSLGDAARDERVACLGMARHLRNVLRTLDVGGIPAMVIKGLALASQTQADFAGRGSGDLDLLVAPESVTRTWELLVADGWRPSPAFPAPGPSWAWRHTLKNYYELQLQKDDNSVDLHWHLGPVRSSFPDFNDLWSRREYVDIAGLAVPTLSRWDAISHSSMHAAKDDWSLLRSLVDLQLLAADVGCLRSRDHPRSTRLTAAVLNDHFRRPPSGLRRPPHVERARQLQAGSLPESPYLPGRGTVVSVRRLARDASSIADIRRVAASTLAFPGLLGGVGHKSGFRAVLQVIRIRAASVSRRMRSRAGRKGPASETSRGLPPGADRG
jgi:hypothetical protein